MAAYQQVSIGSRAALRRWLRAHHRSSPGAWFVTYKKATGRPRPEYADVVEELLCFGWVDSRPAALDDERSMLLGTPRKATSRWSRLNKQRVARLVAARKMTAAGLAVVEQAKRSGAWTGLDAVERLAIPGDLATALRAHPGARTQFDGFPRGVRRNILEWITGAKRPSTRAARVAQTAELAGQGRRANQWRDTPAGQRALARRRR
jgi:uncharacterized protein YdeI (YjbR/CyaY-like superfamily)